MAECALVAGACVPWRGFPLSAKREQPGGQKVLEDDSFPTQVQLEVERQQKAAALQRGE